jgi:Xaa-Pro aminopeptidase
MTVKSPPGWSSPSNPALRGRAVSIEDDVVVTTSGVERLTGAPSDAEAHEL